MNKEKTQASKKRRVNRTQTGNILVLSCVCFAVACAALIMGYSFASLFFVNNRLQAVADEIAIAGAKKLNDKDRIGQINNMVARCRQLVYSSRKDLDDTKQKYPDLVSFAEPLLNEARDSAYLLESERRNIAGRAQSEAAQIMQSEFDQAKGKFPMTLPWLKIETPKLTGFKFGRIEDVQSNVEELKSDFKDLKQHDDGFNHIDRVPLPGLPLYRCDVDFPDGLKLPGDDNNLTFKLSSLPAPVDGIIAPAREVLPEKLKDLPKGSIPSAAGVSLQMKVETGLGFKAGANMALDGTATTTGACPQE
jgi:hypothetical protein